MQILGQQFESIASGLILDHIHDNVLIDDDLDMGKYL